MEERGPQNFWPLLGGPWKKYHKFSSKNENLWYFFFKIFLGLPYNGQKWSLHAFLSGWPVIFMAKKGVFEMFCGLKGGPEKFSRYFFLH